MNLVLVTPPAALPVSLEEAKTFLRVDESHDDSLILGLIESATQYLDGADGVLGRALVTQTWDLVLDRFPLAAGAIQIPLPPLVTVVGIAYFDPADEEQAFEDFAVDLAGGRIVPEFGAVWPATRTMPSAVSIRFTAGKPANQVAQADKLLILELVAHHYGQREPAIAGGMQRVPEHLGALIAARRRLTVG